MVLFGTRTTSNSGTALSIRVPQGAKRLYIEFACGDTQFQTNVPHTEQKQSDGYYGKRGWAKLCVTAVKSQRQLMIRENVPPSGVLACIADARMFAPGEELVVESKDHPTWLMGYRVLCIE